MIDHIQEVSSLRFLLLDKNPQNVEQGIALLESLSLSSVELEEIFPELHGVASFSGLVNSLNPLFQNKDYTTKYKWRQILVSVLVAIARSGEGWTQEMESLLWECPWQNHESSMEEIPVGIEELINLKKLHVSRHRLTSIPKKLPALHSLDLSENPLRIFPKEILTIGATLQSLHLSDTMLREIPSDIDQLKALENLDLSNNIITNLPSTFVGIQKLKILDLSSNKLTQFPMELLALKELRHIDLNHCALDRIPASILDLPHLKTLHLNNADYSISILQSLIEAGVNFDLSISSEFPFSQEDFLKERPERDKIFGELILQQFAGLRYSSTEKLLCFYLDRKTHTFYEIIGMGVDDYSYWTEFCTWTLAPEALHTVKNFEELKGCSTYQGKQDLISGW